MSTAQNLWSDEAYIANLQSIWRQPSSMTVRRTLRELVDAPIPRGAYLNGLDQTDNRVLDVGCGTGLMSELFRYATYSGCDSSNSMLEICSTKGLDVKFGSVYDIQESDKSVDLVICHAVLFHVASVNEGIKELWRVTKGRLIYSLYYAPLFTAVKTPPFVKFQFNHRGAQPILSEDMPKGKSWWSIENVIPSWQVTRFVRKYIKPRLCRFYWFPAVGCQTEQTVFCVLDR